MTIGCQDIGIRKSKILLMTQFLKTSYYYNMQIADYYYRELSIEHVQFLAMVVGDTINIIKTTFI